MATDGTRVDGFEAPAFVPGRLLVYHYVTKSRQVGRGLLPPPPGAGGVCALGHGRCMHVGR